MSLQSFPNQTSLHPHKGETCEPKCPPLCSRVFVRGLTVNGLCRLGNSNLLSPDYIGCGSHPSRDFKPDWNHLGNPSRGHIREVTQMDTSTVPCCSSSCPHPSRLRKEIEMTRVQQIALVLFFGAAGLASAIFICVFVFMVIPTSTPIALFVVALFTTASGGILGWLLRDHSERPWTNHLVRKRQHSIRIKIN